MIAPHTSPRRARRVHDGHLATKFALGRVLVRRSRVERERERERVETFVVEWERSSTARSLSRRVRRRPGVHPARAERVRGERVETRAGERARCRRERERERDARGETVRGRRGGGEAARDGDGDG